MEESMQRSLYYVVTKGFRPGVYSSWEEAKDQILNYTFPEVHGFNSYEHAVLCFKSRMSSICAETGATEGIFSTSCEGLYGSIGMLSREVCHQAVSWLPVIPEEELNARFAIMNNMEDWLVRLCHQLQVPGPCFFKQVRFLRGHGPYFRYTVIVPGDPFNVDLVEIGRYSLSEMAAREDAATVMLSRVVEITGKEIRDYNYCKVKLYMDSNNALRARVAQLEEAYNKLKASYEALANSHASTQFP